MRPASASRPNPVTVQLVPGEKLSLAEGRQMGDMNLLNLLKAGLNRTRAMSKSAVRR